MIRLDKQFLSTVDLAGLSSREANLLLKHTYELLEWRTGKVIADRLTEDQLDAFEDYFERKDERGAFAWLQTEVPDYPQIVQAELDRICDKLRANAIKLLTAAGCRQGLEQRLAIDLDLYLRQIRDGTEV